MDFEFDATTDWRRLKLPNVIDEHSRLCLAIRLGGLCKAKDLVAVMEELTSIYPAPVFIPGDNGPGFNCFAEAQGLRPGPADLVRGQRHHQQGSIAQGSPGENGCAELFNGRFWDEFLATELFAKALEAQILVNHWCWEVNSLRPHSALQGLSLLEAAQQGDAASWQPSTLIRPGPTMGGTSPFPGLFAS